MQVSESRSTHVFAVISWGCAATNWLAKTLNSHPEILCLHAGNRSMAPHLQDVPYFRMLASQGHRAAGDVHGVRRSDVPALREAFGADFGCAIVVRDPLPRLKSQFALFRRYAHREAWGDISYVDPMIKDAGLAPEALGYEDKLLFHGANMLNAILDEKIVGASIFRSEDITSDPVVLLDLVTEVTGGNVERDDAWARRVISEPAINRHSYDGPMEFDDLQQRAIKTCVKPESWTAYAELGYH